jgi:PAS domain S-box-containing protein
MSGRPHPEILYVDDDEANRLAFRWVLRGAGFDTREATTGRDALRLAAEKPDLIILDVNLPDLDGFEVCRRIKAHPATAAIPVLHLSGVFVSPDDRSSALEGGADAYLTKPAEPRELVATVKALLRMHEAEESARAAAAQWQATFDAIHDSLAVLDLQGRLLRCNQALADLLGRPVAEVLGRPYGQLLREVFGAAAEPLTALLGGATVVPPRELPLGERWLRVSSDAVRDEHGEVTGLVHLLADVTSRRNLEDQLRQAQKMEAVGRLAGGVAHDFNNLLTAILGNLSLALADVPAEQPLAELLRTTEAAAWRAADLTRQLLGFSRRTRLSAQPVDLNACAAETMALLGRTLGPGIEVKVRGGEKLWPVFADPGQIQQVLLNLCLNARDAMPEGGRLVVEAANVVRTPPASLARAGGAAARDKFVRLSVEDTGVGIAAEVQPRIFDPFFTTKEVGQGTGLGLALVFGIVQQHHGWIECRSQVGEGSRFDVYLPRHREPAP